MPGGGGLTHRLNLFVLVLAVLVGLPFYVLLLHNPSRQVAAHPLHLTELRRLADSLPGPRPQTIQMTMVGWDRTPSNLLAAGSGIKRRLFTVMSFRLDTPGTRPIVIDTGTTPQFAVRSRTDGYRKSRQRRVDADMISARAIIATDESFETLGGLARLANEPGAAHALTGTWLNSAQVPATTRAAGLPWPDGLNLPATVGASPRAIAPGVVVVPTGAPTPGSQMVYVRLADGREYVFAGPVARYAVNAAELRTRSRLLDWWEGRQDRAGTMRWLVTLRRWQKEAPGLYIVPGHDVMTLLDKEQPSGLFYRE